MKKDIKNLTQEIFKNRELLRHIGFSQQETEIFYNLIQGKSITTIAEALNLSPYQIRKIRNQKFHLIPIFMRQKIALIRALPLTKIYQQLAALEVVISDSITSFKKFYTVPIQDLSISRRTANALMAGGIKTANQLCEYTPEELLILRNIGEKAIIEIEAALEEQGFCLRKKVRTH